MSSGLSEDFKELVRSRTDIVQLIGERVSLESRRGGREYVGLCPFHDDHKPSMTVNPERQSYKCWSCNEGGDCFSFVQKSENVPFKEALEMLAQRAHLEMPRRGNKGSGDGTSRSQLYEVLTWAANEFQTVLKTSSEAKIARDYLAGRGFTDETVSRFRLGYHPPEWEFLVRRARGKYTPAQLLAARLIQERSGSAGYFDCFVDRVLFPIHDAGGRTVAFGGRQLPGREQPNSGKYINSADGPVFSKNRLVYGLDVAKPAVVASGTAIVTEGYTDCILAHQHGIGNVVGTLGTALTENHVIVLKRLTRKVVLVYDGDAAGQMAAERSLPKFLAQDIDLRILTLPAPLDPADYLTQHGAESFLKLVNEAPEAWEYKLKLCAERYGFGTIDARHQVLTEMVDLIAKAPRLTASERENLILGRLAHRVGVSEQVVRKALREARGKNSGRTRVSGEPASGERGVQFYSGPNGQPTRDDLLESELLEIVFSSPETVEMIRREISPEEFRNEHLKQLLQWCFDLAEAGVDPDYGRLTARLEDAALKRLAVQIDEQAREKGIREKLRLDEGDRGESNRPALLGQASEKLHWRRRQENHEETRGEVALVSGETGRLDSQSRELLRRAMEYHGERATKKSKI